MWPFWEVAIAPVLEAAGARRIVEIGAFRGENTEQLLERLGSETVLHVIDPVPDFDPEEHERRFAGQYVFHRDLSVNVLPGLEPMDAALIDGDHNWYTVYHELSMLRDVARQTGAPLPVMLMHDVLWPYGRRDLYYDPSTVPAEFRQPYKQAGMRMDRKKLLPRWGLNPDMNNAEVEGGPRNGVMTALEDWMAEHDRPLRRVVLPVYYGLAIVAEEERLQRQPELAAMLDHLEGRDGKQQLMELGEEIRLRGMVFQHNVFFQKSATIDRLSARYLDTIKGALLNEHYLETEVRIAHLADSAERGRAANLDKLRDPVRHDRDAFRGLQQQRRAGAIGRGSTGYPFTDMGRIRLDHLGSVLDVIREEKLGGDLVECGTGRGGGAIFMKAYVTAHELKDRTVWVADPFDGSTSAVDPVTATPSEAIAGLGADLNSVRAGFARFDLLDDDVRFLMGALDATLAEPPVESIALLRIGRGLGPAIATVLDRLYDRLAPGGFLVIEGTDEADYAHAVEAFRSERGVVAPLEQVDAVTWTWRRSEADGTGMAVAPAVEAGRSIAPLAGPVSAPGRDLSVVIVAYDMQREMQRSLLALSRSYQRGIEDVDYEVIVVENGSPADRRLDPDWVRSFGPEFRYLDMGADATPSPTGALNRGIQSSNGSALVLMIDGAHVLTPGVLRFGISGLTTYAPAIVATQQWYVGPGQQGDVMQTGYDQAYEDKLFENIGWPEDGYRLFDIGHFVGTRDWFDGVWESNCLFAPRSLVEQVGGFDEGFSMPGGGYTNLEIYERLGSTPGVTVATIIGEGSFHQVHGGTTTNQSDPEERRSRVFGYGEHFESIRGRRFISPNKPLHYVGGMQTSSARRTHSRRMAATAFAVAEDATGPDGRPDQPVPMPDDLRTSFIDAYWRTLVWRNTTWLGQRVPTPPTDLVTYQEIMAKVRPDVVIETGSGAGGRALYLASVCELLGHGRVISVDAKHGDNLPQHPRITYVDGQPHDDATVAEVRRLVGDGPADGALINGMVVLGSRGSAERMRREFDAYCGFVGVGSYLVMEDTILNGHPVFPGFGPGPQEGVRRALADHGEFVADSELEKHGLTFNPGGFLRRVR